MLPPGRHVGGEASLDRIASAHHHDRDCRRRALGGAGSGGPCRDNQVNTETRQLRRELRQSLRLPGRRSNLDREVLTLDISELLERPLEHLEEVVVGRLEEDPDSIDTTRLLRLHDGRHSDES